MQATETQFQNTVLEVPAHLRVGQNQQEVYVEKPVDNSLRCVVFVGDLLTMAQKQDTPYRLGGKMFPESLTMPNLVLARCAITPLKQGMMAVNVGLIEPREAKNYIQSYVARNVWNEEKQIFEDVEVGKAASGGAHLVFKAVYPAQEIGQIAYRRDGVTEVKGISSTAAIKDAQLHYFPDWLKIIRDVQTLPPTLLQLQEQLDNRRAAAESLEMRTVGDAFLGSCEQFRAWGTKYIADQTSVIEAARKIPGAVARYDEIAERLFGFLGLTRQDSLIQDMAQNQAMRADKLDNVIEQLAQRQTTDTNGDLKQVIELMTKLLMQQNANQSPVQTVTISQAEAEAELNRMAQGVVIEEIIPADRITEIEVETATVKRRR